MLIPLLLTSSLIHNAEAGSPYMDELNVPDYFEAWDKGHLFGNVKEAVLQAQLLVWPCPSTDWVQTQNHTVIVTVGKPASGTDSAAEETEASASNSTARFEFDLHSSTIVVSEDFAKEHGLDISVTNKRLIPVPDDFSIGGELKTVLIPSLKLSDDAGENHLELRDVTAFVANSKTKNISSQVKRDFLAEMTIGLGALNRWHLLCLFAQPRHLQICSSAAGGAVNCCFREISKVQEHRLGNWTPGQMDL